MSRRQNRKRRRARERRAGEYDDFGAFAPTFPQVREEEFLGLPVLAPPKVQCGRCHEFVEDGEGGRGTCLHPASGIMFPWYDTPGCDFYRRA
jgi:hypothetical protein